jgi:uncharacterized protein (DUF952 family)
MAARSTVASTRCTRPVSHRAGGCHHRRYGRIAHLSHPEPARWAAAQAEGWYAQSTRGATLREVGFIHCSFGHQVQAVANRIYRDWAGPLLLLEVDSGAVPAPIRTESLDGGPEAFPHIYGPLPTAAVRAVHQLQRHSGGWRSPAGPE